MTAVAYEQVSVVYPGEGGRPPLHALEGIDLALDDGEFVVLLGASGCGKTTLLSLLAGFQRPTSGRVLHRGAPVSKPGADRGVVFQQNALLPWLSVLENVALGPRLRGAPKAERHRIARTHLESVGLSGFEDHAAWQLSGGMQQRVGIARALANEPDVLLMDEPLGALDAFTRAALQELLLRLWARTGRLVLFVTHSIEEALFLATRVVVMSPRPGRIQRVYEPGFGRRFLEEGAARAVRSDPEFIALREEVLSLIAPSDAVDG